MSVTGQPPYTRMLAVYAAILIVANAVLEGLFQVFPDFELPNSIGAVLSMAAALAAGQSAARSLRRPMTAREKLVFAVGATILMLVLAVIMIGGLLLYHGVDLQTAAWALTGEVFSQTEIWAFLSVGLLVGGAVNLAITFLVVGMGVKTQLKALERQAQKAAGRAR